MSGRRLLFFFDGSGNVAAGERDVVLTNVSRLNQALTFGFSGTPQIVFYFAGVGTRGDTLSAATGRGFDQIVMEAFVNLASNYMDGDTIYLFGFSRGAAAARALSGLLSNPGLLSADHLANFPELWRFFTKAALGAAEKEILLKRLEDRAFKPEVQVLAAFDTVAGSSWDQLNLFSKVRFHNLHLDSSVKCGIQILAIDDDRLLFSPLLWDRTTSAGQTIEQIWMPGVHSDVGGCSDGRLIGDIALLTMIERVQHYCPELEWDNPQIDRLRERIASVDNLEITSERPGLIQRVLWRSKERAVGEGASSYVHPIYPMIAGKKFRIKERVKEYIPRNVQKDFPVLPSSNIELFEQACKRALS